MEAKELICFRCKHFDELAPGCKAFPDGIPDEITGGENKHQEQLKDQENDLTFTPA
jgi:hypothetical protein